MGFIENLPGIGWIAYSLSFLVALTIIVFIHEYGHFKIARLCGMKVDVFSIGFGRELWGWVDRFGTRWKIGMLPIGGYVKFAGDANAASMPDTSAKTPPKPDEFHGKPLWQRALVVSAGPIANFILAFFLFAGAYFILGDQIPGPKIGKIMQGTAAAEAGLLPGDVVRKINSEEIETFTDIVRFVAPRPGQALTFQIDRSGELLEKTIVPKPVVVEREFYGKSTIGQLGIEVSRDPENFRDVNLLRAAYLSAKQIWFIADTTLRYMGRLLIGQDTVAQLGGVGSMAKLTGDAATSGIYPYIATVALLSVSIGLINLFPIPLLDGGHLLFYAIEAIRRKPLGPQAQEWGFRIGFALVIFMMLVGNMNDVMRAVFGNLAY